MKTINALRPSKIIWTYWDEVINVELGALRLAPVLIAFSIAYQPPSPTVPDIFTAGSPSAPVCIEYCEVR